MFDIVKLADVFFNGRPAGGATDRGAFMAELVRRGTSVVKHNGRRYRVVVTKYREKDETNGTKR